MPTYVDAGTVRIQQYIARTTELRLRRGASWRISQSTSAPAIEPWIRELNYSGVSRNPEAGDVDGVVCLQVPDGRGAEVARELLLYLRDRLPAAELQARWGQGATYLEALAVDPRRAEQIVSLPGLADFPLAYTCEYCRADYRLDGGEHCADCAMRKATAGWRSGIDRAAVDALGTEKRLVEQVDEILGRKLAIIDLLENLAPHGEPDGKGNHLATIAVDGNALGAFFTALAAHGDSTLKQRISPALSEATFAALVRATSAIVLERDPVLPVVPHVVGGDDVVVSVIADRAWPFALAFLSAFDQELSARVRNLGVPEQLALPTVSAGIAFAEANFPYARWVALAEQALRHAKRQHAGRQAAISWLDVTEDGEQLPPWRAAIAHRELSRRHTDLDALAALPAAARHRLARLLANPDPEVAESAALVWARRTGDATVPRLLADTDPATVRNLLALVRWWLT